MVKSTRSAKSLGATRSSHVAAAVLTASRALVGVSARSLAVVEDEVTLAQYRALVVLAERGALNVGELATALELHRSTVTRLCDRLARKGLIERSASRESRREVNVALSDGGRRVIDAVTRQRRSEIAKIVRRIPTEVRDAVVSAFVAFAEAAGEVPDDAWKLGWTE